MENNNNNMTCGTCDNCGGHRCDLSVGGEFPIFRLKNGKINFHRLHMDLKKFQELLEHMECTKIDTCLVIQMPDGNAIRGRPRNTLDWDGFMAMIAHHVFLTLY